MTKKKTKKKKRSCTKIGSIHFLPFSFYIILLYYSVSSLSPPDLHVYCGLHTFSTSQNF